MVRYPGKVVLAGVCIVCLCLVSACSQKTTEEKSAAVMTEKILEHATGKDVDVNIQGGNVAIKGKDFKTEITQTAAWPSDMFAEVPLFKAGKVERVVKDNADGMQKFNIYLKDFDGDAVKKYDETLKDKGWQSNFMLMGKGGMITAQKGKLALNFPFNTESKDGTLIVYTVKE